MQWIQVCLTPRAWEISRGLQCDLGRWLVPVLDECKEGFWVPSDIRNCLRLQFAFISSKFFSFKNLNIRYHATFYPLSLWSCWVFRRWWKGHFWQLELHQERHVI